MQGLVSMQAEGYKLKYTNYMRFVSFVVIGSHCGGLEICEMLCVGWSWSVRLPVRRSNVIFSIQQINNILFQSR